MHQNSKSLPRTRAAAKIMSLALATAMFGALAGCSDDGRTVTVTHPEVEAPVYVDLGDEGPSVGDQRLFHFDAVADDGSTVLTDWVMTTTGVDVTEANVQARMVTGVFSFGTDGDQLILEGVALYPGEGATLKVSSTTFRSIIGGSGKYAGASGWVESVHNADGTWQHTFHID